MAAGALVARSRVFSASEPLLLLPLVGAIPTSPLAVEGCVARRAAADRAGRLAAYLPRETAREAAV